MNPGGPVPDAILFGPFYIEIITDQLPGGSAVTNLPAKQETWIWFLGREDPLERKMVARSGVLA